MAIRHQNRAIMKDWLKTRNFWHQVKGNNVLAAEHVMTFWWKNMKANIFSFGIMHTDESYRLMSGMCIKRKVNRVLFL